ncbi:MAG: Tritrans,polycis-undecaprenyl-diphosphate synthase (GGDP specific) [Methanosaeta sp. PtaU1.Bin060]|jgi:undecaprenyl diphosphate synthase|nr:MAG: Tritrans,polycis-undecaprenyl-diphosphate synthase (GGDP specific) [Methanosaeta sp. PtaU1.Bin060]
MLHHLYERLLEAQISKSSLPGCVAVVLGSEDLDEDGILRVRDLLEWSASLGLGSLVLHIDDEAPEIYESILSVLSQSPAEISLHTRDGVRMMGLGGNGCIRMAISLGCGGKEEVLEAFRKLLYEVEKGALEPEEIDEEAIESCLRFSLKPDMVIRAGGKQLSDFMIWQAAYSELYFTDVNWPAIRKIDFLRAIRDCQRRNRRFGR